MQGNKGSDRVSIELKGLKNLKELDNSLQQASLLKLPETQLIPLPIANLISGKYQPRKRFDEESLTELAQSIKSNGIIQPLIVRVISKNSYEIIAGERRWRAAKMAGLALVPAIIKDISDETALAFGLIENVQREDLNPIEQAFSLKRLQDEFFLTHEEIAETVGCSRSTISNLLRLLSLSDPVKTLLIDDKIEMGHARALLSISESQQIKIAEKIVLEKLSVRQTESLTKTIKAGIIEVSEGFFSKKIDDDKVKKYASVLSQKLMHTVKINVDKKGKGKIIININSMKEIESLIDHIKLDKNN